MSNITPREKTIRNELALRQKQVTSILGDKKKSDKFLATALKISTDYALRECHPLSIVEACISVAELDLDLSKVLSQVYLVPFKAKRDAKVANVQLIISARGYTAMMARTGWKVKSFIVTEADEFTYEMNGFEETIKFKKDLDGIDSKFRYAVAMAKSPDGSLFVEVMNKSQIEKHRLSSQNQTAEAPTGVWNDWFDQMSLKTVIKKLIKKLPIGEHIAIATGLDDKPIDVEVLPIDKSTQETAQEAMDLNNFSTPDHNPDTGEIEPKRDLLEDIEIEVN